MSNIMEKIRTTRILGAIGIAGLILGIILPYIKYEIWGYKLSIIPTVLSAIFAIYVTSEIGIEALEYCNLGFYAMWIGTISLVGYAFLHRKEDV